MPYTICVYCGEIIEIPAELVGDTPVGLDGRVEIDDYCYDACEENFTDDDPNDFYTWDYDR
jgi:hypothetical protein